MISSRLHHIREYGIKAAIKFTERREVRHVKCEEARKKIDLFFELEGESPAKQELVWQEVLYGHMAKGSEVGKHKVSCEPCWQYYKSMKQRYCGG